MIAVPLPFVTSGSPTEKRAVCPATSAWDLHRAWPEADFHLIPSAGHSAKEPGIERELVAATDRFRSLPKGHVRGV